MSKLKIKCENCLNIFEVYGYRKDTVKYCSIECMNISMKGKHFSEKTEFKKGQTSHNYKGIHLGTCGRNLLASKGKVQYAYRYFIEKLIKRKLKSVEHIHHKDNNKLNDILENYMVFGNGGHRKFHQRTYDYIVEKGLIEDYINWFQIKFKKTWKTVPELIEGGG